MNRREFGALISGICGVNNIDLMEPASDGIKVSSPLIDKLNFEASVDEIWPHWMPPIREFVIRSDAEDYSNRPLETITSPSASGDKKIVTCRIPGPHFKLKYCDKWTTLNLWMLPLEPDWTIEIIPAWVVGHELHKIYTIILIPFTLECAKRHGMDHPMINDGHSKHDLRRWENPFLEAEVEAENQ